MQQFNFTGSVVDDDGRVIYRNVWGEIWVRQQGATTNWDGVLEVESGEPISLFTGKLVIDGRSADVFARHVQYGLNVIEFRGNGPPPVDAP